MPAIPVIVLGEFRFGIAQSRRAEYERWLADMASTCTVLDITAATAVHYAAIRSELKRARRPIPSNDVRIAALCREHRFTLLSSDRHFERIRGLHRLEWRSRLTARDNTASRQNPAGAGRLFLLTSCRVCAKPPHRP